MNSDREVTDSFIKTLSYKHSDFMRKRYSSYMKGTKDVSIPRYEINFICPISHCRMKRPVRGVNCKHLQCIEAYFFIKTGCVILGGDTVIKVQCPVCNVSYQNLTEVFIDGLQQEIISMHPSIDSVVFKPDGSYSIPETDKENPKDFIDLTDVPDEPILIDLT